MRLGHLSIKKFRKVLLTALQQTHVVLRCDTKLVVVFIIIVIAGFVQIFPALLPNSVPCAGGSRGFVMCIYYGSHEI